ncbi:MAG: hypothetical protein HQL73_12805 [Magnetococcales bacterium]|nr:hypothetical protein [Magnetococcales bacterium]
MKYLVHGIPDVVHPAFAVDSLSYSHAARDFGHHGMIEKWGKIEPVGLSWQFSGASLRGLERMGDALVLVGKS